MPGILSEILDTTGKRLQERLAMEKEFRVTQSQAIIDALHAVDENGVPKLSPEQQEQAWEELSNLNKAKGAKQILAKAREVFGMIGHGGQKRNSAMAERAKQQTMNGLEGGQGGNLVPAPQEAETDAMGEVNPSTTGATLPFTPPPPGGRLQPVQQVANAAAAQGPTPPPKRLSMPQIVAAGSPAAQDLAKSKAAANTAAGVASTKVGTDAEAAKTQHGYRLEEIEAGKKDVLDREIDTYTNADGFRVTKFMKPDGSMYETTGTQKVMPTGSQNGKNYQAKEIEDPKNPRVPLMAIFDPDTGQYLHPVTKVVLENVRPYVRPESSGLSEMRNIQKANGLRDDYNKESQSMKDREDIYGLIDGMRSEPQNGPNDIVLLYNFVKLNDPNAAREGELELVQRGASIPDTWKRYVGQFLTGNVLGPDQRVNLLKAADNLYKTGIRPRLQSINTRYSEMATRAEVDPRDVVRPTRQETDIIDGVTYYKHSDGKWYKTPE